MDYADAQIEIALLASVERQAQRTASALARVHRLMQQVRDARDAGKAPHAQHAKKRRYAR